MILMLTNIYQTRVCLPEDLGCVSGVDVDNEQCLEGCQGIIANVMTTKNDQTDLTGLESMLAEYEDYKRPNFTGLQYPRWTYFTRDWEERGENQPLQYPFYHSFYFTEKVKFANKLHFVQISFSSSSFDRIIKGSLCLSIGKNVWVFYFTFLRN